MFVIVAPNNDESLDIMFSARIFQADEWLVEIDEAERIAREAPIVRFEIETGSSTYNEQCRRKSEHFESFVKGGFALIRNKWAEMERFIAACKNRKKET